jgi:hypothetical protein
MINDGAVINTLASNVRRKEVVVDSSAIVLSSLLNHSLLVVRSPISKSKMVPTVASRVMGAGDEQLPLGNQA